MRSIKITFTFLGLFVLLGCKVDPETQIQKPKSTKVLQETEATIDKETQSTESPLLNDSSQTGFNLDTGALNDKLVSVSKKEYNNLEKKGKKSKSIEDKEISGNRNEESKDRVVTDKTSEQKEIEDIKNVPVVQESIEVEKDTNFANSKKEEKVFVDYLTKLESILSKYVTSKGVNYKGLKRDEQQLNEVMEIMIAAPPGNEESRNVKLAYWINLYNVATLKLVLDNYPLASITDLHNGKPWDVKWIEIEEKSYSLNNIENDIIRPVFKEPRIHFAVNCAAKSCPPLLNHAFKPSTLDAQLEKQTKDFISNSEYNTISESKLQLSKIFDWYGVDFGDLKSFLAKYLDTNIINAEVSYKEYDWALNTK